MWPAWLLPEPARPGRRAVTEPARPGPVAVPCLIYYSSGALRGPFPPACAAPHAAARIGAALTRRAFVSRVVARVIGSNNARFQDGDVVWGFLDWALRSVARRGEGLHKIDPSLGRISHAVSVLGMPGLTAT